MTSFPGVMWLHLSIFPPFAAAIYYARKSAGKGKDATTRVLNASPRWLRLLSGAFFAYALVNFFLFLILSEGGTPRQEGAHYSLASHGHKIRDLTEAEYHRQQAYAVRGFSGHWMLFSAAALAMLIGARRLRHESRPQAEPAVEPSRPPDPDPEPATRTAGLLGATGYALCLVMILSNLPVLALAATVPITVAAVINLRRRRGFPAHPFESVIGCLSVFPNAIIATVMGNRVAEFIYLAIFVGLPAAITGRVRVITSGPAPYHLSNGQVLHTRIWAALETVPMFPVIIVGLLGLTFMSECAGRWIELRRKRRQK